MKSSKEPTGLIESVLSDHNLDTMRKVLIEQHEILRGYNELFTTEKRGFKHGIVVAVQKVNLKAIHEGTHAIDVGTHVIIDPRSQFAIMPGYPATVGIVSQVDPVGNSGWAEVSFGKVKHVLRYNHDGKSDILVVGKAILGDTNHTMATVSVDGMLVDIPQLFEAFDLAPGDTVLLNPANGHIVSKRDGLPSGTVAEVDEILVNSVIVSAEGRRVCVPLNPRIKGLDRSDRVLLDKNLAVILTVLPKSKSIAISSDLAPFEWDDIIGLNEAKQKIMTVIEKVLYPELFNMMDKKDTSGILLEGPPGNGKTVLGRAVATLIAKKFGQNGGEIKNFVYIKASEIIDMYVGEGPRKVREIFALAEEKFKETGIRVIIFIDELDAVGKKRGGGNDSESSDSITNAFLMEMAGLQKSYGVVIGATNRADILDPAFLRPGRFDHVVDVGSPVDGDIPKHFALHLRKVPLEQGYTIESMAAKASEEYVSDKYTLYSVTFERSNPKDGEEKEYTERFTLKHMGSGAVIMGIVEKAKERAIKRNKELFEKRYPGLSDKREISSKMIEFLKSDATPLLFQDIVSATEEMAYERRRINHDDDMVRFMKGKNDKIIGEKKHF